MIIKLKDVLDIPNPNDYKLHFARRDTDGQEAVGCVGKKRHG